MYKLISVIVPVYNVEKYVKECVDSLLAQTYHNIEIILVDDGSTDGSGAICDSFVSKDSRIKVFHKLNGGVSDARNFGIENSSGDFITFVDSDDFVSKDYIISLHNLILQYNADISMLGYYTFYNGITIPPKHASIRILSKYQALKAVASEEIRCSVWGCAFNKRLFYSTRFPKGKVYEDIATMWKLISESHLITIDPTPHYYYRQNPQSIMNSKLNNRVMDIIPAHKEFSDYLIQNHPELSKHISNRLTRYCTAFLYRMMFENYENKEHISILRQQIKNNLGSFLFSKYSLKKKMFASIISMSLPLAKIIAKRIK